MTPPLPVVSGRQLIATLEAIGYEIVRQKGSHVRLRHPGARERRPVTVPLHRELRTGLLRAIIRDAGLTPDEFREMCR